MDGKEYRQQMLDELSRTLNDLDDREILCRGRESRTYDERLCHAADAYGL